MRGGYGCTWSPLYPAGSPGCPSARAAQAPASQQARFSPCCGCRAYLLSDALPSVSLSLSFPRINERPRDCTARSLPAERAP